jgi:DNA-binding beta-propeller fold protein YncE
VDGEQVAVNSTPGGSADGEAVLTAGWHDIRVRFVDSLGFSFVNAFWQPPDGGRAVIPSAVLRPWPAYRVGTARPEDADIAIPTAPPADVTTPSVVPIVPPETAKDKKPIGEGRVLTSSGAVLQPRGVAVAPDGAVYVADGARAAVVRIAPDGTSKLLGEGKFKEPSAVALYPGGLAVVDAGAGMVFQMSPNGEVGERLFKEFPLYGPRGLTGTPGGDLVLADTGNDRLLIRTPDGVVHPVAGLSQPTGGTLLPDGTLLAAEVGANRVVQMSVDGKRLNTWTMPQSVTVNGPHVALLPDGGWLVSLPEDRALMARPTGAESATLWTLGEGMKKPTGLGVSPGGIFVVDIDNANVRVYPLP